VILLAAVIAFALAAGIARSLAEGRGFVVLDHPNERSLHDTPMPRTGGLAIVAAIVVAHALALAAGAPAGEAAIVGAGAAAVFIVSLCDDVRGVPMALRMLVHAGAASWLVYCGLGLDALRLPGQELALLPALAATLSVLSVVWLTNLYNFMDGMDGFAGGMGAIGFATLALLAWRAGDPGIALRGGAIAAACTGFLLLNFPPARLFMGDAGSSVLGFAAAATALEADRRGVFALWLSLLVFSPFVVDATVTLCRRAINGEPVWRAHRSHFYQRLVQLGWGHRRTTLRAYVLMAACAASALAVQHAPAAVQAATLFAWALIYAILMLYVTRLERARGRE
jgi:UDP-N-acetylmuramyl pentapeptide phosphotransferase/UDP-N-acetylglucosamine-1-phosphate transferase